jgi:hypothetical protein
MVANNARAPLRVRDDRYTVSDVQCFLSHNFVRYKPCDRVIRSRDFRQQLRFGVVVECAGIGHLSAGFGVDHGAVEHYFAAFARFQFADRPGLA